MGVAEAEEAGVDEQEGHEYEVAGLRHVTAEGGDQEDGQLGGRLEVPLHVRLAAQPGALSDGLQVRR